MWWLRPPTLHSVSTAPCSAVLTRPPGMIGTVGTLGPSRWVLLKIHVSGPWTLQSALLRSILILATARGRACLPSSSEAGGETHCRQVTLVGELPCSSVGRAAGWLLVTMPAGQGELSCTLTCSRVTLCGSAAGSVRSAQPSSDVWTVIYCNTPCLDTGRYLAMNGKQ